MAEESILHSIVEADRAARQALAEAQQRQKLLQRGGGTDILAAAEEKASARARIELEMQRQRENEQTQRMLHEAEAKYASERAALEQRFSAVKDECIETIFKAAVGLS